MENHLEDWCLQRQLLLSAESIPGVGNCIIHRLSRQLEKGDAEWCLNDQIFRAIRQMTFEPSIDLFASCLNAKLGLFVSWHPEPEYHSVDAYNLCWTPHQCYAFPPFCLIARVLSKLQWDYVQQFLLITPIWPTQTCYPPLLTLSNHEKSTLVNKPTVHPMGKKLRLAAWILSASISEREAFLSKQPNWFARPGRTGQKGSCGNGVAGFLKNKLIHFKQLQHR